MFTASASPVPPAPFPMTDRPLELALPSACQVSPQTRHADGLGAVTDASWALKAPGVPDTPKLTDYYFRAVHAVTESAKHLVQAFYHGKIERSYFDLHWQLDPVAATQAGVAAHDGRYGRFSPDAIAPHLAALKAIASALEESTAADLDAEIDRTALLNEVRVTLRRFERFRPQATNPEFWLSHLLSGLHHLLLAADRSAELDDVPFRVVLRFRKPPLPGPVV